MIRQYFQLNSDQLLPIIFLYTEIHHRFKYLGSMYYKKEPEIVIDMPHRVEPNSPIPMLLLIKDANQFPIKLINIHVEITFEDKKIFQNIDLNVTVNERWWNNTFYIDRPNYSGLIIANAKVKYIVDGNISFCNQKCSFFFHC